DELSDKPGLTATEMFDALESGKMKAVWIICTNPLVSLPDSRRIEKALQNAKFVVVQDISHNADTAKFADLLLPAAGWLEKDGTMTNSERRISYLPKGNGKRINTTGGYFSYLKIAEGCDKHCTYCIIPSIRGNYRSVPMESLIEEATILAESGIKELMLVAQETTLYGVDIYGKKMLSALLKELCKIPKLEWIRILYCYPEEITDELIQTIKEEDKICNYLDIPIQHSSDSMLKRMGRRTSRQDLINIVEKLRKEIPNIALRTTLITGFPGETETDQEELLEFVNQMEFDRLGVFTYSPEEGTPAAIMENQIPEEIKIERQQQLMELQQEIAFEKAERMLSQKVRVMIEGKLPEDGIYIGRTYKDAPNVDGLIFVNTKKELLSGDMVNVFITEARDYDLMGEMIEEQEEI
ncbi:MAG: 30S ribosomal protein S12 methylthiotransferase RimO, partial [Acetivibrio sp.]